MSNSLPKIEKAEAAKGALIQKLGDFLGGIKSAELRKILSNLEVDTLTKLVYLLGLPPEQAKKAFKIILETR